MIDHLSLRVSDFARSKTFYDRVLGVLGYRALMEFPGTVGYGDTRPILWLTEAKDKVTTTHLAFVAKNRAAVNAFHEEAIKAGGTDFGGPGPRPIYHAGYYGAFVLDFDGHNIEAVVHKAE